MVDRRTFLKGLAGTALAMHGLAKAAKAAPNRPNIVIVVTDDQGYADLGAYAHHAPDIHTPNMDRIAAGGVLMTHAYVTAPVCSPSRAGWNTGRYQQRWGHWSWGAPLPTNVRTLAEHLKAAGYVTGKVGKSDFGHGYHKHDVREYPLNHGFDEFLGFSSHAHDFFLMSEDVEKRTPDPHGGSAALGPLMHNRTRKEYTDAYTTEIFTDWAIDFLARHKDQPFFLTVAYNSVHHLIHEVPEKYLRKHGVKTIPNYDPDTMGRYSKYYNTYNKLGPIADADMRKYYLANLNCLDDQLGRLLDAMDRYGLADNTLLIYFGDNGGSPLTGACNRPLRGSKYILFEGGIRVPFMARWPGKLPKGATYAHRVSTLDVLPTCLAAAGRPAQPDAKLDGASFLEAVRDGKPAPSSARPMFWHFGGNWAVRDGDWKLVRTSDRISRKATSQILSGPAGAGRPRLYDLEADPAEQNDLAGKHPDVVRRLEALYQQWRAEMPKPPAGRRRKNAKKKPKA